MAVSPTARSAASAASRPDDDDPSEALPSEALPKTSWTIATASAAPGQSKAARCAGGSCRRWRANACWVGVWSGPPIVKARAKKSWAAVFSTTL